LSKKYAKYFIGHQYCWPCCWHRWTIFRWRERDWRLL